MNALSVQNLRKRFGSHTVLDGLSFDVPEHSVFGFLGQNGAGKTTAMKLVLGLLPPDGGRIEVLGEPVRYGRANTNRFVGYLPDVPEFYAYLRPMEYLKLCGEIAGMQGELIRRRSEELLELVGLQGERKRIGGFSRGMKQRLGIAQALLHQPRLLLCDEPTSALDPVGRKEILDILERVKGQATVVFSTHILSDVERVCDRIAVLHKGRLALSGSIEDLKARHKADSLLIEFDSEAALRRFLALPLLRETLQRADCAGATVVLHTADVAEAEKRVLASLHEQALLPVRLEVLEPTLENLFLEAVQ